MNANMQLCLFIPIGMIKCWFGTVHTTKVDLQKVDGVAFRGGLVNTLAYLRCDPMMSEASRVGGGGVLTGQNVGERVRLIPKWGLDDLGEVSFLA